MGPCHAGTCVACVEGDCASSVADNLGPLAGVARQKLGINPARWGIEPARLRCVHRFSTTGLACVSCQIQRAFRFEVKGAAFWLTDKTEGASVVHDYRRGGGAEIDGVDHGWAELGVCVSA